MQNFDSLGGYCIVLKFSNSQLFKNSLPNVYGKYKFSWRVFKTENPLCLLSFLSSHNKNTQVPDLSLTSRYLSK